MPNELATSSANTDANASPSAVSSPSDPQAIFKQHKHRLKVEGKELDLDYDDVIARAQKSSAADKRFKEASDLRKDVDGIFNDLRSGNHKRLVDILGHDQAVALSESMLNEHVRYLEMPEDQRARMKAEQERDQYKSAAQKREEQFQEMQMQQLQAQAAYQVDAEIAETIKGMGRKPTPRLVYRLADQMIAAIDHDGDKVDAKTALSRALRDTESDVMEFLEHLPDEDVTKYLPQRIIDAVLKQSVNSHLSRVPMSKARVEQSNDPIKKPQERRHQKVTNWVDDRKNFFRSKK